MILRLWRLEYPKYCAADLGFKALHLRFGENLAIELFGVLNVGLVSLSTDPCVQIEEPICKLKACVLHSQSLQKIFTYFIGDIVSSALIKTWIKDK